MNDGKKLTTLLNFLNNEWVSIEPVLSDEDASYLRSELEVLAGRLQLAETDSQTGKIAKDFIPIFSNIPTLNFLAELEATGVRSTEISQLEEDIKEKLIKHCKVLKGKLDAKELLKDPE